MAKKKYKSVHNKKRKNNSVHGSKTNKKLIKILVVATLLVGSVLVGLIYMNMKSAVSNVANADESMELGDFRKAYKLYGKAVSKELNNLEYISKLQNALIQITPKTQEEAVDFYNRYIETLVHAARYNPSDIDAQLAVANEMHRAARVTGSLNYWKRLQLAAKAGLEHIALDNPRRHELTLFVGLSSLRIEDATMTETYDAIGHVRFPGENEIELAIEADPGNAIAWAALAHGRMALYYRLTAQGKTKQASLNFKLANETMQQAIEVAGESFDVLTTYFRDVLLQRGALKQLHLMDPRKVTQEELEIAELKVTDAQDALIEHFDPEIHGLRTPEVVSLLLKASKEGPDVAIQILQKHIDRYPKDYARRYLFSTVLRQEDRLDEAEEVVQVIIDAPQQTVSLEAIEQFSLHAPSAHLLVELAIHKAIREEDETARQQLIKEAKNSRELLLGFVSNNKKNNLLLYADGLIALAEKNYDVAAAKIELVISRVPIPTPQQLRHAAIALGETGSKGLATVRLASAIEQEPENLANYLLKARLELQMSDFVAAKRTLNRLPDSAKEVEEIAVLLDIIAMKNSDSNETVFTDEILFVIASSERMNSLGQVQEAITLLLEEIDRTESKDWRLLVAMSNLYMSNEDIESAIAYRKEALQLRPDLKLQNEIIAMESGDRVEAIIAIINSRDLPEGETAQRIAVELYSLGMKQRNSQIRWSRTGDKTAADEAEVISTKAFEHSKQYQERALELGVNASSITLMQFNQALFDKDLDLADELINEYSSMSTDEIELSGMKISSLLLKGEMAKADGDFGSEQIHYKDALEIARANTEERPFSDVTWSVLGMVHSSMGHLDKALSANEEAYRIAPKSKENIRSYVGSLYSTNADATRLLRVIRLARTQHPSDKQILEVWLDMESQRGNLSDVLSYRNERYMLKPKDRNNTINLAAFYMQTKPTHELLLNVDGSKKYPNRTWEKLPSLRQNEILREAETEWVTISNSMLVDLAKEVDPTVKSCFLHTSVLRDRGRLDEASKVWEKFIETRKGTDEFSLASIAAADFFMKADKVNQAITLLKSALEFQSDIFEVDSALGSMYFLQGEFALAAESLERPTQATNDMALQSRRIEALAMSSQFEEAEKALVHFKTSNNAFSAATLEATIHRVQSSVYLAQGKMEEATESLARYRKSLKKAIDADPTSMLPYFKLCSSLLNEYRLTQNKELLEEALAIADAGDNIGATGATLEQFAIIRADVLQADGQLQRAIERLVRYIAETPSSDAARQRLVEAYLDSNNVNRAIAVVEEGIQNNPRSSVWLNRLGDLEFRVNNNRENAAIAYIDAMKIAPTVSQLLILNVLTRTEQSMPDLDLIAMARGVASQLHPVAKSIEAKSLMNLNRSREAVAAMEVSWGMYNTGIDRGWIPAISIVDWFVDLKPLFKNGPEEGERMARRLASGKLTSEQQYGLANFYKEYGIQYVDKTIALIDESVNDSRTDTTMRANLLNLKGGYLVEVGKFEESKAVFKQLVEEFDSALVLNNYAYVVGVYMNEPEEGLILAKKAAKKAPRNPSIIDTVSELYQRTGNFVKAAEMLDYLVVLDPSNAKAMAKLAILNSEHLKQPERGIIFAERARSISPRLPEVLDALGWSYFQLGREDKAKDYLQRSLREGETMNAYVHLAQVVTERKEYDKALDYLRMAQELAEDSYSKDSITALKDDIRSIQVAIPE